MAPETDEYYKSGMDCNLAPYRIREILGELRGNPVHPKYADRVKEVRFISATVVKGAKWHPEQQGKERCLSIFRNISNAIYFFNVELSDKGAPQQMYVPFDDIYELYCEAMRHLGKSRSTGACFRL